MEGNVCRHCSKDLTKVEEIHAVEGMHFCTAGCAVAYRINEIILNAKEVATQWYDDCAEVVTPGDIGLI